MDNGHVRRAARHPGRATALLTAAALVAGAAAIAVVRAEARSESSALSAAVAVAASPGGARPAITTTTTIPPPQLTARVDSPINGLPTPQPLPADPEATEPLRLLGTIEIPALGLVHDVYEGVTLSTIDRGPGHWPGTALPGHRGNAVFAGHRVTHSHPFMRLNELEPGDEVIFTDPEGRRFVYEHVSTEVVTPDTLTIANQTWDRTATLFACHPPGSARFRIVAHLELVRSTGPQKLLPGVES